MTTSNSIIIAEGCTAASSLVSTGRSTGWASLVAGGRYGMRSVRALNEAGPCITLGFVLRETETCIGYRDRRGAAKSIRRTAQCILNHVRRAPIIRMGQLTRTIRSAANSIVRSPKRAHRGPSDACEPVAHKPDKLIHSAVRQMTRFRRSRNVRLAAMATLKDETPKKCARVL
jgi:hypothetical protein